MTGAQKKSTEGRPTGDLRSPLKIEVRSALRAPPDERPAGAPQMLCAPPPRGGGGGDRYATAFLIGRVIACVLQLYPEKCRYSEAPNRRTPPCNNFEVFPAPP